MSTLPRKRSRVSTTFGTTLIAGGALSGWTRRSTREVTGTRAKSPPQFPPSLIFLISRDDKRYTEKKNKTERARRKKEDIAKVRGLVDLALRYRRLFAFFFFVVLIAPVLSVDPRIKRIKQQEKEAREAKKRGATSKAGPLKTKQQEEQEKKQLEEEARQKEAAEQVRRPTPPHLILCLSLMNHLPVGCSRRGKEGESCCC